MIVAGLELTRMTFETIGSKHLAGLRARVVKLTGLTNDDRPRADPP